MSMRSDADWHSCQCGFRLTELADDARFATGEARLAHRGELLELVSAWTRERSPQRVAEALQSAGVPAAQMNRPPDVLEDPQLRERKLFSDMHHPLFDHAAAGRDRPGAVPAHPAGAATARADARAGHP